MIESLPVPRRDVNVCDICRNPTNGHQRCLSCNEVTKALGLGREYPVPRVFPLGLAVKRSPLAQALWDYKRSNDPAVSAQANGTLSEFIDARLPHIMEHVGRVNTYTFVPGRPSRSAPVKRLIEGTSWASDIQLEDTLEVLDFDLDTHVPDPDRFWSRPVTGDHIVIFDDTFTRGATALSGARALYEAGAARVTVIVVGRHNDRDWLGPQYLGTVEARCKQRHFCPECDQKLAQQTFGSRTSRALDEVSYLGQPVREPEVSATGKQTRAPVHVHESREQVAPRRGPFGARVAWVWFVSALIVLVLIYAAAGGGGA